MPCARERGTFYVRHATRAIGTVRRADQSPRGRCPFQTIDGAWRSGGLRQIRESCGARGLGADPPARARSLHDCRTERDPPRRPDAPRDRRHAGRGGGGSAHAGLARLRDLAAHRAFALLAPYDPQAPEGRQGTSGRAGGRRQAIALAAYAGLRSGEVRALEVRDVDLKRNELHVRRAFSASEVRGAHAEVRRRAPRARRAYRGRRSAARRS